MSEPLALSRFFLFLKETFLTVPLACMIALFSLYPLRLAESYTWSHCRRFLGVVAARVKLGTWEDRYGL